MMRQGWKGLALAGLLGALGLTVGCENRREGTVRDEARQAGQAVDKAAREAREAAQEAREAANEAEEGFQEGLGGSGVEREQEREQDEAVIGDEPGVINDGEGPIEENERR
ncbi:hypothetical protein ACN28I_13825 [Archangium gephyra]|uniref:hypothetical protein n=1 Tax=Archangium gephyra TaxID=48 RepID=UPI003B7662F2